MRKNIIITGKPKSGKSTLIQSLVENISPKVGFFAREVRSGEVRTGFEIVTSTGEIATLAQVISPTVYPVGRYFVDRESFDAVLPKVFGFQSNDFLYVDEIGQMELFSDSFKELVLAYLDSVNTCVATLSCTYDDDFTKELRLRKDVFMVDLSPETREEKAFFVAQLIKKIEKAKKYLAERERFVLRSDSLVEMESKHGTRKITRKDSKWNCDCDFFKQYAVCSHVLSLEDIMHKGGFS